MICDICGSRDALVRKVTRGYGRLISGRQNREAGKIPAVEPAITGQQPVRFMEGMGANQKIGQNPLALSTSLAIRHMGNPGRIGMVDCERYDLNADLP